MSFKRKVFKDFEQWKAAAVMAGATVFLPVSNGTVAQKGPNGASVGLWQPARKEGVVDE